MVNIIERSDGWSRERLADSLTGGRRVPSRAFRELRRLVDGLVTEFLLQLTSKLGDLLSKDDDRPLKSLLPLVIQLKEEDESDVRHGRSENGEGWTNRSTGCLPEQAFDLLDPILAELDLDLGRACETAETEEEKGSAQRSRRRSSVRKRVELTLEFSKNAKMSWLVPKLGRRT